MRGRGERSGPGLLTAAVALLAVSGLALGSGAASASPAPGPGAAAGGAGTTAAGTGAAGAADGTAGSPDGREDVSWRVDLSRPGADDVNVRYTGGGLRLADPGFSPASMRAGRGYGSAVLPVRGLDRAVGRVTAEVTAELPGGARVEVDVRGRDGGGAWTEWREATGAPADLPRSVTDVQARLTLWGGEGGGKTGAPAVRSLRLTAGPGAEPAARPLKEAAAFSARVYATREGLVGHTTANGHVIQPNDHFVALPSRRGLSPKGSGQYSVRVCGPARCETAPVWDVGPWNTHDDYWNPSSTREMYQDLARGLPEAQAAYQNGYNGGKDEFGRRVANPAGIDLADGTFYNIGLNDNGWVTVTYLWTDGGGGSTTSFPTWGTDVSIRASATTNSTRVASLPGPTTVRVRCQVHGQLVNYQGYSNDAWSYLPDYGGYVSNIFIDVADAWLPGVPNC
ncbi:hypothetical protein KBZ10_25725 [Streptomyces sp. F63]|uniref:hypothetical protein n=1 Tax=Streptomyces sp. F63 TaxID=2824887 RepID=UPI001B38DB03|nr:hypothetical protein [Streptomyces sp. F63]MBQ0987856.1 hypothetical protein [Streptomyces sp. F63]